MLKMLENTAINYSLGLGIGGVVASLIGQIPIVGWSFERTVTTLLFSIAFMVIGSIFRTIK